MAKCIYLKLKETVNNDDLPKVGALKIHFEKGDDASVFGIQINATQGFVAEVTGSHFTSDGTENYGQQLSVNTGTTILYIPNETANVFISKQAVSQIGPFSGDRSKISFAIEDIKNIPTLTTISVNQMAVVGDIINLPKSSAYLDLSGTKIGGDISDLNLSGLTHIAIANTDLKGDIACFNRSLNIRDITVSNTAISGNLSSLSAKSTIRILKIDGSNVSGSLTAIEGLTNLTTLSLSRYITGNLSSLRNCSSLAGTLDIHLANGITGNLSDVSHLTNLTYLYFSTANITGDLASIQNLVNLTNISFGGCNITGAIESLSSMTHLGSIYIGGSNNAISGDLSTLPNNVSLLVAGNGSLFSWAGNRSASAKIISMNGVRLGDYVDAMLINQANGTPTTLENKNINVYGNRTSASDQAVTTLIAKGYTVFVNDAEVVI